MDTGKYIDFHGQKPNEMYLFDTQGEIPQFKRVQLDHIVAGDSDSCYLKLDNSLTCGESVDDIVDVCDEIAEYINEEYPDFLKKSFNVPDSRLDSMLSNREVVSDKSFFVTKKRYAMHIVDDEGKRVDKLKIMGLEVKKSDTSVAVKDFLMKLINMVIDGCEMTDLQKAKKQFKKDFFQMGIRDLGVPMPATKLPQYEQEYRVTGEMKGFPYHYRAAIFYNSLCGNEDREIYAGEKFYVCNIQHMDSKYIAIPLALNKNPAFVDELVIDYEKMWEKANKKIDNYMESLGWDLKSRMEKQATDLFGM